MSSLQYYRLTIVFQVDSSAPSATRPRLSGLNQEKWHLEGYTGDQSSDGAPGLKSKILKPISDGNNVLGSTNFKTSLKLNIYFFECAELASTPAEEKKEGRKAQVSVRGYI